MRERLSVPVGRDVHAVLEHVLEPERDVGAKALLDGGQAPLGHAGGDAVEALPLDVAEDGILAGEVVIERAAADAACGGDVVNRHLVVALLGDEALHGVDDRLPRRLRLELSLVRHAIPP